MENGREKNGTKKSSKTDNEKGEIHQSLYLS